jgi:hypothetical protein
VGTNGQPDSATNLTYTKFIFVLPLQEDAATLARIRAAGSNVSRGFFNDYDADGTREVQPQETIQFLQAEGATHGREGVGAARYVVHVSANYRPRLVEVSAISSGVSATRRLIILDGAGAEVRATAARRYRISRTGGARAAIGTRLSQRDHRADEQDRRVVGRQRSSVTYFYPHHEDSSGSPVNGHAKSAEAGIRKIFRRLYHNPDGYQRPEEFDFVGYFECTDENLPVFDQICRSLRDERQNPEWKYVIEGPEWRGKRVLRW